MLRPVTVLLMAVSGLTGCVSLSSSDSSGTTTQTTATAVASTTELPYDEILADLREYIDVPGDPIAVRYGSVPIGSESDDRVPGPVDYQYLAVIKYATVEEAAATADVAIGPRKMLIGDFYPDELKTLGMTGEWGRQWLDTTRFVSSGGWVESVAIVDGAPQYIIVEYRPQSS